MSFNAFYKQLANSAVASFPNAFAETQVSWDYLVSPLEIELPKSVLNNVTAAVEALFRVSHTPQYAKQIHSVAPEILNIPVQNHSVLMAYDFHTTESGDAFLVEINTNASGFLLASVMEATHDQKSLHDLDSTEDLKRSFFHELELCGRSTSGVRIVITDEDIPAQKMYPEFVMYRELFEKWGWRSEIVESKDVDPSRYDFIYNRMTDFYLESPQHVRLRESFASGTACWSPHPREYALLADKQRLVELATPGWLEDVGASSDDIDSIRKVLIPTFEHKQFGSPEEIWAQRKSLFFKPKRSFGAKSVYRGESVSRKVFERLMHEDPLIQKFVPAQRVPTDDERSVLNNWKFDLRCFAYEGRIQLVAARIYQGQVTNFASPLGGFTRVRFK